MVKVLGLDISGTATGWAYGVNGKLEGYGKYIGKASEPKGEKLLNFYRWLEELLISKKPDIIIIEKPYRGRNSNVLANISKFIAIAELLAIKILNLEIQSEWFIDPKTVKKIMKVKPGKDYEDNKRLMVHRVNYLYGIKLKFGNKKSKIFNDDDTADAIALVVTWWKLNENKD